MEPGDTNNNSNGDEDNNVFQLSIEPGDLINNVDIDNSLYELDILPVAVTNNANEANHNNNATGDHNYINNANTDNSNGNSSINGRALTRGARELEREHTNGNRDVGSGSEQGRPIKKKRYHRHSQYQIQEMEAFFKECPHPDDKQRKELSQQLGISHLQIKFWFQNKRTQNKTHQERHENGQLRTDNDLLRADNYRCREAIYCAKCPACNVNSTAIGEMSFEEHHLRLENSRLREEIRVVKGQEVNVPNNQAMNYAMVPAPVAPQHLEAEMVATTGRTVYPNVVNNSTTAIRGPTNADKPMLIELAIGAMEELMNMAQVGEPLWIPEFNGTRMFLNLDEYERTVQKVQGPRLNGFRTEASRDTAVVFMNLFSIVGMLMNADQWSSMFPELVGKAATHAVFSTGVPGSLNGEIHLMSAEYTVASPLIPTRESYFLRYYKQHAEGLWAVVDVSLDQLLPNLCWRRPSGCLIQQLDNGFSQVIWVEHVEVENRDVNYLFRHLISTGQALDANRWVSALNRKCERLASMNAVLYTALDPGPLVVSDEGKKMMLKLGDRMMRSFFTGVTTSTANQWALFSGGGPGEDIRVMTSESAYDPGKPPGTVLCAAASFWVPASPNTVFTFLKDESNRSQWDVITTGMCMRKMSEIANGSDSRNGVSLFRSTNFNQDKMLIFQETSTDPSASYVIYAPVDETAVEVVVLGGDPDIVAVLPSGFVILPDGTGQVGGEGGGSLLTVAFQMLVETTPSGHLSMSCVATVENMIRTTMETIKTLFPCHLG